MSRTSPHRIVSLTLAILALLVPAAVAAPSRSAAELFPYPGEDVTLINHRGLSPGLPENTLAAYRNSIALGVDAIEIDLRQTADGEIVIVHDDTVDRTTDGTGLVADLTLAQIKALDAGGGERVPTFAEALDAVRGSDVRLLLDIKDAAVTERAVRLTEERGMIDQVIVGPRTVENLRAFKALDPGLATLGFIATPADAQAMIDAGVDAIRLWPYWILPSRDDAACQADYAGRVAAFERGERDHPGSASCVVQDVVDAGVPVWTTVNDLDPAGMDELIRLGATGVLSDRPADLAALLTDVDAARIASATDQVGALRRGLREDASPGRHVRRQAVLLRRLVREPRRAREILAELRQLRRDHRRAVEGQRILADVERRLRAGDVPRACAALRRVVTTVEGLADRGWEAREAARTLACGSRAAS